MEYNFWSIYKVTDFVEEAAVSVHSWKEYTLKMEARSSSETQATIYKQTRRHIPEELMSPELHIPQHDVPQRPTSEHNFV